MTWGKWGMSRKVFLGGCQWDQIMAKGFAKAGGKEASPGQVPAGSGRSTLLWEFALPCRIVRVAPFLLPSTPSLLQPQP